MMNVQIKKLRKQMRITQSQLAERLNVSQSTVASWENGTRRPDLDLVPAIAAVFGVSVNDIYGAEPPQEEQDEVMQIREMLRRGPSYRTLFKTMNNATPEHVRAATAMLKALEPNDAD